MPFPDIEHAILISGVVGSTAYGINTPGSDIDRMGVFALPTSDLFGFKVLSYRELGSYNAHEPDVTLHEALKYCHLASKCNPAVLELLWLPGDIYELLTDLGDELVDIREAFLSGPCVRNAYLGYATQQVARMRRGTGIGVTGTPEKRAKYARHVMRLVDQGIGLYRTGQLQVRLDEPERYLEFGIQAAAAGEDLSLVVNLVRDAEEAFDSSETPLPNYPDMAAIEAWLQRVRRHFLDPDIPLT